MITFIKKHLYLTLLVFSVALAIIYWGFVATPRYVSKAIVVMNSSAISSGGLNLRSIISGSGDIGSLLLLREALLSVDMMDRLDTNLALQQHFS